MSSIPYFHSQSLRQRFIRHLQSAHLAERIDREELHWLQRLTAPPSPGSAPDTPAVVSRLVLEDASPVPLALASAILITRPQEQGEILYLDTLSTGLERFTERAALAQRLKALFSVRADLDPAFEYQVLPGPLFEQRTWNIVDHQASTLAAQVSELEELPALTDVLQQALPDMMQRVWPDAWQHGVAPLVQLVSVDLDADGRETLEVLNVLTPEQTALDMLAGERLGAGQRLRLLDRHGEVLQQAAGVGFDLHLSDLQERYEALLAAYWRDTDRQGLSRRDRRAQLIANGFAHRAWHMEHAGHLDAAALIELAAVPLEGQASLAISRLSVSSRASGPMKLVGLYLLHLPESRYALYSPRKGIEHIAGWEALVERINTLAGRAELHACLSLDDQNLLPAIGPLQLHGYALQGSLFIDCMDAIIALQKRNLGEVLKRRRHDVEAMLAMIDDALDVRGLIDPRLTRIRRQGRWQDGLASFSSRWPDIPAPVAPPTTHDPALSWMEQVTLLGTMLGRLNDLIPDLETLASNTLSPWLAVLGDNGTLEAADLLIGEAAVESPNHEDNHLAALPQASSADVATPEAAAPETARPGLSDLLLERLTGLRSAPLPAATRAWLRLPPGQAALELAWIEPVLIERILAQALPALNALCASHVGGFYLGAHREDDSRLQPGQVTRALCEHFMRLELEIAQRMPGFTAQQLDMLRQVLERPGHDRRLACGERRVEVWAVGLAVDGRQVPLALDCAWALFQPDQTHNGLLFWSLPRGLKALKDQGELLLWLSRRLSTPERRERWLELFADADQHWIEQRFANGATPVCTLHLKRVDTNLFEHMQADARQRQQQDLDRALQDARHNRLAAEAARRYFALALGHGRLLAWLDILAMRIQRLMLAAILPDWLRNAKPADLECYNEWLERYYLDADPVRDFLADIPLLPRFAEEKLLTALRQDFPDQVLDPQLIKVSMTRYVAAPVTIGSTPSGIPAATLVDSETLVNFALNHFSTLQGASISVSQDGRVLPERLTGDYLRTLVHRLDVGLQYRNLLARRFDPAQDNYAARRSLFMQQIPARLMLPAQELKMEGRLSARAFDFIQCVVDMPDARARQPVHGQDIVLRPLALVPRHDMQADVAEGLFLIGPKDLAQGPVVLHMLFSDSFGFREYRDRDDLLAQLRASPALQRLVLARLDPQVRKRYQHGGTLEAHIPFNTESFMDVPPAPEQVTLGSAEVAGNALRHLFETLLQLLQSLSRKQSVTSAEADWASFVHLMTLGAEQVLMFVPGKLGLLVAAWQSQNLFRESANAALEKDWGKALSELSVALGMLASNRREEVEGTRRREPDRVPEFSWRNSELTADLRRRLRQFEVQDIELDALQYDQLYNLYQDPVTQRRYAAVAGRVYEVEQHAGIWQIKGQDAAGPKIRLNPNQQWELNLALGLRGGAPVTAAAGVNLQSDIEQYMTVQAQGLDAIRIYSREHARQIGNARHKALVYLQNTLFNLNTPFIEGLPGPVQPVLQSFFGVAVPEALLIDRLRFRINELFLGLSEPSLTQLDSQRFVIGNVKPGHETLAAFVFPADPEQRIFLGEMFFSPPLYGVKAGYGSPAFNADEHFRAMAMMHELSHLISKTQDFAYLDASAPPLEMLDDRRADVAGYKQRLEALRETALSHRTPLDRLFTTDDGKGGLRDFSTRDGAILPTLLRLSGQPTLAAARHAFLNDARVRHQIILNNADSIVMLVALLGRRRFT